MAVKILHTADWQIGKAFAKMPEDASVPLREQRISTIKKIAAAANEHNVNAVVVAGDVFEFETISERTLHQVVHAMSGYTGPWLLLPGNHDPGTPESVWNQLRQLEPPSNIVIVDKPQAYELTLNTTVILCAPLQRKHEPTDITEWFDAYKTAENVIRIGLAHGSLDNRLPERGEAPNTISDKRVQKAELDYLALGDWHGTLEVDKRIWYSGTHETDRFRDNDSGNALIVTIDKHGDLPKVERIKVGHYTWCQQEVLIDQESGAEDIDRILRELSDSPEKLVVQLIAKGTADLQARARIEKITTKWSGLLRYLELKDEALVSRASEEDLDQLGRSGFVAEAVRDLRALADDPANPDREIAGLALQMLFAEHKQTAAKR